MPKGINKSTFDAGSSGVADDPHFRYADTHSTRGYPNSPSPCETFPDATGEIFLNFGKL
jgi:hypothetical protein